jgi:hypothetical protein
MRFFLFVKEVSSETGDDYCLSAVVPLPGYLIFFIVIQNMTKSTIEPKS